MGSTLDSCAYFAFNSAVVICILIFAVLYFSAAHLAFSLGVTGLWGLTRTAAYHAGETVSACPGFFVLSSISLRVVDFGKFVLEA